MVARRLNPSHFLRIFQINLTLSVSSDESLPEGLQRHKTAAEELLPQADGHQYDEGSPSGETKHVLARNVGLASRDMYVAAFAGLEEPVSAQAVF